MQIVYCNEDPTYAVVHGIAWEGSFEMAKKLFSDLNNPVWLDNLVRDLARWPWKKCFGEPLQILKQYTQPGVEKYFSELTHRDYFEFLNHTERVFYLLHGYERPESNHPLRKFFMTMFERPTCLLPLSSHVKTDKPSEILERLSAIDLDSIPFACLDLVQAVYWNCLDFQSLSSFLKKKGYMCPREYDLKERCFICSINEYPLYNITSTQIHLDSKKCKYNMLESYFMVFSDQELLSWTGKPFVSRRQLLNDCLNLFSEHTLELLEDTIVKTRCFDQRKETIYKQEVIEQLQSKGTVSCTLEELKLFNDPYLQQTHQLLMEANERVERYLAESPDLVLFKELLQGDFLTTIKEIEGSVLELPCFYNGVFCLRNLGELTEDTLSSTIQYYLEKLKNKI